MIKLEELRQILDLAREHDLSELEVEADGQRVRIRKQAAVHDAPAVPGPPLPPPASTPLAAAAGPAAADADLDLAVVKSPIVGTFYRAPAPNAPPFVQVGDAVRKGQTLCIIEAMKMMNNIDSEYEGTVVKVYVENGQPVQYGERLFAIRAS